MTTAGVRAAHLDGESGGAATAPSVSIVVPVRNGEAEIGSCLASLLRTRYPESRREILVVDNGSTDATSEIVRRYPVRCAHEPRRGPSHARNRGVEESGGDIVAFVDADCVATTGWLRELAAPFRRPEVQAVAGEILSYPPDTRAQRYMALRKSRWQKPAVESRAWPFAITANLAVRRDAFEHVGLFDPLLVRAQDKDFGRRFLDAGLRLEYAPRAIVLHRHRATTRGLFRQHLGWGFGAALLHLKYDLPWRWRDEAAKYRELIRASGTLVAGSLRYALGRGDEVDLYYPYYEFLRRLAHRLGLLKGLAWRARRGWNPTWPPPPFPASGRPEEVT